MKSHSKLELLQFCRELWRWQWQAARAIALTCELFVPFRLPTETVRQQQM